MERVIGALMMLLFLLPFFVQMWIVVSCGLLGLCILMIFAANRYDRGGLIVLHLFTSLLSGTILFCIVHYWASVVTHILR